MNRACSTVFVGIAQDNEHVTREGTERRSAEFTSTARTGMQLLGLPEEILVLVLESTIRPVDSRLSLPNSQSLLACRTFHRIGLPILYRTLLLKCSPNAELVRRSLLESPTLVRHVRHLYSRVTTFWLQLVLRAIGHAAGSLHTLDFSISAIWVSGRIDSSDEVEPLAAVPVRRLAVRLGSGWVMHDRVLSIVNSLAEAIERWPNLACPSFFSFLPRRPNPNGFHSILMHVTQCADAEDRRSLISNLACCFRRRRYHAVGSRLPSLWRCPARPRSGFCARAFRRSGIPRCSSRARIPA